MDSFTFLDGHWKTLFLVTLLAVTVLLAGSTVVREDFVNTPVLNRDGSQLDVRGDLNLSNNVLTGVGGTQCSSTEVLFGDGSCGTAGGSGSPGGVNNELQYNNGGSFGGTNGLVWDETHNNLSLHTDADAVISFNNSDNSWQYLQFMHSGTRQAWLGLNDQNDFQLHKEDGGNIALTGTNVGIGTTSPAGELHVEVSNTGGVRLENTGAGQEWRMSIDGDGDWNIADITANTRPLTVQNTAPDNSLVVDQNGNVGIGTTSPVDGLYVDEGNITIDSGSNTNLGLLFRHTAGGPYASIFRNTTSGDLYVRNDQGEDIVLDTTGNIGIGTSSAISDAALTVERASSARPVFMAFNPVPSDSIFTEDFILKARANGGHQTIGFESGGNWVLQVSHQGRVGIMDLDPETELSVDGSADITGNLSIGTATPDGSLHVLNTEGTAYTDFAVVEGDMSDNLNYPGLVLKGGTLADEGEMPSVELTNGGLNLQLKGGRSSSTYTERMQLSLASNSPTNSFASIQMYDGSTTTDHLYVDGSTGNTGIGTTSPATGLHVVKQAGYGEGNAALVLENPNTTLGAQTGIAMWIGGEAWGAVTGERVGTGLSKLHFRTRNGGSAPIRMTIDQNGQVGVGTTSPDGHNLHISGSGTSGEPYGTLKITDTSSHGGIVIDNTNNQQAHVRFQQSGTLQWQMRAAFQDDDDLRFYSWDLGADVLTLEESGQVGVGTNSPSVALDVNGDCVEQHGNCADVAELYPASEAMEAGELVAIDTSSSEMRVEKAGEEEQPIGVVSTQPAILFNGSRQMIGGRDEFNPREPPVALAGRVPVKVSLENGPIRPGDSITVSSEEGVGMKAESIGAVVGTALESYTKEMEDNTILVFVNPGHHIEEGIIQQLQQENREYESRIAELEGKVDSLKQAFCNENPDADMCLS